MHNPILIGAVAYDPRVVPIWEGMRDYFRAEGPAIDYVLFSNYDSLVAALLDKTVDIAWNTNLAWVKLHHATKGTCRALAMRDVDADFKTIFVARTDVGVKSFADLKGKRLALGSADSAQAAILPLQFLRDAGIDMASECKLLRFDLDVGKHGDTGTSELEVLAALKKGEADVGAIGDATWIRLVSEGKIDTQRIGAFWTSPGYCHCNFSVLSDFPQDVAEQWTQSLLRMSYDDPRWRELMVLEGLKKWLPTTDQVLQGYESLFKAAEEQQLREKWPSF